MKNKNCSHINTEQYNLTDLSIPINSMDILIKSQPSLNILIQFTTHYRNKKYCKWHFTLILDSGLILTKENVLRKEITSAWCNILYFASNSFTLWISVTHKMVIKVRERALLQPPWLKKRQQILSIRDCPLETCTTNTQTSVEIQMKSGISKAAMRIKWKMVCYSLVYFSSMNI